MIVYHSNGLHVGIYDRRTDETESATLKVLAEHIGFDGGCRAHGGLNLHAVANDLSAAALCPLKNGSDPLPSADAHRNERVPAAYAV